MIAVVTFAPVCGQILHDADVREAAFEGDPSGWRSRCGAGPAAYSGPVTAPRVFRESGLPVCEHDTGIVKVEQFLAVNSESKRFGHVLTQQALKPLPFHKA